MNVKNNISKTLQIKLKVILIFIASFSVTACNAQDGFLDTLDLGNISVDEVLEKVKDKNHITRNPGGTDPITKKHIEHIFVEDPLIANYRGYTCRWVRFTAFDNKIFEYDTTIKGEEKVNKIVDIIYAEYPDIKLMDDDTSRSAFLKKHIDKNTVLTALVGISNENKYGDEDEKVIIIITYTSNIEMSKLSFFSHLDHKVVEKVKRISIEKNEEGHYYIKRYDINRNPI